jgi:hypothetical protein
MTHKYTVPLTAAAGQGSAVSGFTGISSSDSLSDGESPPPALAAAAAAASVLRDVRAWRDNSSDILTLRVWSGIVRFINQINRNLARRLKSSHNFHCATQQLQVKEGRSQRSDLSCAAG